MSTAPIEIPGDAITIPSVVDPVSGAGGYEAPAGEAVAVNFSGVPAVAASFGSASSAIGIFGPGNNRVTGSPGADAFQFLATSQFGNLVDGGPGTDTIIGGAGNDTLSAGADADHVAGGLGADRVRAGLGDDSASGGEGGDTLFGNGGNDSLSGEAGDDVLFGGGNDDLVFGGDGNDVLYGDRGSDTLEGGAGSDTFAFEAFPDREGNLATELPELGADTLNDFTPGEDKIAIDRDLFPALDFTTGVSVSVITGFDTATGGGDAKILYDPENGLLYYNPTSGEGDTVLFADLLDNPASIAPSDFEII